MLNVCWRVDEMIVCDVVKCFRMSSMSSFATAAWWVVLWVVYANLSRCSDIRYGGSCVSHSLFVGECFEQFVRDLNRLHKINDPSVSFTAQPKKTDRAPAQHQHWTGWWFDRVNACKCIRAKPKRFCKRIPFLCVLWALFTAILYIERAQISITLQKNLTFKSLRRLPANWPLSPPSLPSNPIEYFATATSTYIKYVFVGGGGGGIIYLCMYTRTWIHQFAWLR